MSESLKNLLDRQATSVAFKPPDLEAIARTGGRRIRRRRTATVLAAVSTVVAVVLGGAIVLRGGADGPPRVPASPWPSDAVSWAFGTTIYVATGAGTDEIEVGHEVRSYVRTATGFVVMDGTDAVYSVTQLGVTPIGQVNDTLPNNTAYQRLVANSSGTLVGWVDEAASPGSLTVRIYDAVLVRPGTSRAPLTTPDVHVLPGVLLFAIDDRTAYWRTYEGVHQVDLDTRTDRLIVSREDVVPGDAIYSFEVYSAENGVLAFSPNDDGTVLAGPSVEGARELHDFSDVRDTSGLTDPVRLSPTGAWLSFGVLEIESASEDQIRFQRGTPMVFDASTGELITLSIPGDPLVAIPSVWLDDNTVQVVVPIGLDSQPPHVTGVVLYRCELPDATCEVATEIGPPLPRFIAMPDGRWTGP